MFTLNCKGNLLVIEQPIVMGIVNVTPDSFYKGNINDDIIGMVAQMINDGATIIDVGGQSTKPNSTKLTADEEFERVIPVIEKIKTTFPNTIISIDTFYSKVAIDAVQAGASIVNDISAGSIDKTMITEVAKLNVPYICMHMQGTPATMQQNPSYENVTQDVLDFFIKKIDECRKAGIKDIIIDPGFGFGKTIEHNYTLLKNLATFKMLDCPILAGLSRKSVIYKTLNTTPNEALNGTTALNTLALNNGATILRVHDVKEAKEAIDLFMAYKKAPL
ncbi:MAG: dihydropteroate synthase [Ferruginibacter sp.]|nr:dihydropteroate synthase [Ferruginibacter sp.]